jgi:hypothetical protein
MRAPPVVAASLALIAASAFAGGADEVRRSPSAEGPSASARGLCAERPRLSPFEQRVRDAIRSRKQFGFRHDRPYVVRVLRRYRRGLTPQERGYVRLRDAITRAIDVVAGYVADHASDVDGGTSIEDSPGRPYVLVRVTRDAARHEAELKRRFPYPDNLSVTTVPYTEASLSALVDRVVRDRRTFERDGFHFVGGGPDIRANRAEIDVITRRRDAREYFERRYGPAVRVRVVARELTRLECTSPDSYKPSSDGRTLRIYWITGPVRLVEVRVRRTVREVRIGIVERWPNGGVRAIGVSRKALVHLRRPVGSSRVVGATTGLRIRQRR